MSYNSPELGSMAVNGAFAPADFEDAEDARPIGAAFDFGGHGSSTPYSSAVGAILTKHTEEIKGKTAANLNLPSGWKKRLRDFMVQKNNDLLDFPVMGPGEILLRRFGNPNVSPSHASVRDMIMDISGEDVIAEINGALEAYKGEGGLKDYANHTRLIYDEYRKAGDEVLAQQGQLKAKLERLDRVQGKLASLFEIDPNEKYKELMEASEGYLKKIYEDNNITEEYAKFIAAYRRFACMRDIVSMSRALTQQENEPICSICLHETVAFALTPCGHTFCQTCIRRQNGQCFVCRTNIREKVKLYFG
jgi:Zinc finger, C3HC4 type (RING finger)